MHLIRRWDESLNSALVRTLEMISTPPKPSPAAVVDVIPEVADEIGFIPDWWNDDTPIAMFDDAQSF